MERLARRSGEAFRRENGYSHLRRRDLLSRHEGILPVAAHEVNHLLIAYSMGYIGHTSLVPKERSRARVMFYDVIPVEMLKVIAAGGLVGTPFSNAFGFGSDQYQIQRMQMEYGGKGVFESKDHAETILGSYPRELRRRFTEILTFMAIQNGGEVSALLIPQILEQAHDELKNEQSENAEIQNFRAPDATAIKPFQKDKYSIIEDYGNSIGIIIRDKDKEESLWICKSCLGENGHEKDCPEGKKNHTIYQYRNKKVWNSSTQS